MSTPDESAAIAPPTWSGDDLSLAVWAALGGTALGVDDPPEDVIDRLRRNGYTWEQAAFELGINPAMRRELAITAAWAGIARIALRRRDAGVRHCTATGASARSVGKAIGMSGSGASRVLGRNGDSPRGRW